MGMLWAARVMTAAEVDDLRADPDSVWDLIDEEEESDAFLDLDKMWHGVHWILTGTAWDAEGPLGQVILGGEEIGEDGGYGPARLLTPEQVSDVAAALRAVSADELRARFDPAAMSAAGVYPDVWTETWILEQGLLPAVDQLRTFYAAAADGGAWVLQAIG